MSIRDVIYLLLSTIIFSCTEPKLEVFHGKMVKKHELDVFIASQMDSLQIAGLSLTLFNHDEIIYEGAFGVKNITKGEPVVNETIFETASLSKPVFSYFVMKQVEKGVIHLDTPLIRYYVHPDIKNIEWGKLITARMVLNHASGFPNWRKPEGEGPLDILFKPGTQYGYSGEGYDYLKDFLCHLLQVDQPGLDSVFQEDVVKVIKAKNMGFVWQEKFASLKTYGHDEGEPTDNSSQGSKTMFGPAGGLHTNSSDYARFLIHLLNVKGQNKKWVDDLLEFQMQLPYEKGELHRSLAFPVRKVNGKFRYWHGGANQDYRSYCQFYKDEKVGVVMLSNSDTFFQSDCAKNILEFLGDKWIYIK